MRSPIVLWRLWALLSAALAALAATFARTAIVLLALGAILAATGQWRDPATAWGHTWLFPVPSGLVTGAS